MGGKCGRPMPTLWGTWLIKNNLSTLRFKAYHGLQIPELLVGACCGYVSYNSIGWDIHSGMYVI